jgi:hypothetical protein
MINPNRTGNHDSFKNFIARCLNLFAGGLLSRYRFLLAKAFDKDTIIASLLKSACFPRLDLVLRTVQSNRGRTIVAIALQIAVFTPPQREFLKLCLQGQNRVKAKK